MKKVILGTIIGLSSFVAMAQSDSLINVEVTSLKQQLKEQSIEIEKLSGKYQAQRNSLIEKGNAISKLNQENQSLKGKLDSVSNVVSTNGNNIVAISKDLGTKIQETGDIADSKISALNSDVDKNRLYWIISTLATLLIGGVIFLLLGKRITSSKTDVESQINNTKKSLEEESIKLDSKLVEVLESQLKIQQAESSSTPSSSTPEKEDHSLAIKVADEIVRMERYISRIDPGTKGLKPLVKGVEKLHDNLKSKGYLEIINNSHIHDLAKFMFGISIFWTYLWFSQFMLIWYADIPEEVTYYVMRFENYKVPFFGMLVLNFIFPLLVLMRSDYKRVNWFIQVTGIVILFGHYIDFFNMIMPGTVGAYWGFGIAELGGILFFAGLFLYVIFTALTKTPLTPKRNPLIEESKHFHY